MQTAYFAFNDNLKDFRDSDWLIAVQTFSVDYIPEKKVMRRNYAEQVHLYSTGASLTDKYITNRQVHH